MIEDLVKPVRTGKKYHTQPPIIQHNIPETTWAYLAGFIDGEANLDFTNSPDKTCKRGYRRSIKMQIYSGNEEQIYQLRDKIGSGAIYRGNRKETPFVTYTLSYFGPNLLIVLKRTLPYLILKKKSAEIMIEALKVMELNNHHPSLALEQKLDALHDELYHEFITGVHKQKYLIQMGKIILDSLEKEYMTNQATDDAHNSVNSKKGVT